MRLRRPRFFTLLSLICVLLCVGLGVMWIRSRKIVAVATPSTYQLQAQLARTVPAINFTKVTLKDALDFLRDVTGTEIQEDWAALESAGMSQDTPITVNVKNVTM